VSGRIKTTSETPGPRFGKVQKSKDVRIRSGGRLGGEFDWRRREGAADAGGGVAFDEEAFVVGEFTS
jgi:hypothetical protein